MKNNTQYDYNEISEGYYDKVFKKSGPQGQWHRDKFKEVILTIDDFSNKKILDVGCAAGTFLRSIIKLNSKAILTGVDYSELQIQAAKNASKNNSIKFFSSDAIKFLNNTNENFDIITMIELAEHFDESYCDELIRKSFDLLSPGGKIILTTPNYNSLWPVLEFFVNRFSPLSYNDQHITKLTKKKLLILINNSLRSSQFVVKIRRFQGFAPFLWFLPNKLRNKIFMLERQDSIYGHLLISEITRIN